MKKLFLFLSVSSLIVSCSGKSAEEDQSLADDETSDVAEEVQKKTCELTTFSFELGASKRTMNFSYTEDGKPESVVINIENKEDQTMNYTYNDEGNLTKIETGPTKLSYVYDGDRLVKINGEGGVSTREFEYDGEGRIVKQVTVFGGKPYTTHKYSYTNGLPTIITVLDKNGEEIEEYTLEYDDKNNPFIGKGALSNSMEMLLGFPAANTPNNVISIKKTYKKKSSFKINGEYKNPGDVDESKIIYVYNEDDYPTSIARENNGKRSEMELDYNCK